MPRTAAVEVAGIIGMVVGRFANGREASPTSGIRGTWLGKFICLPFVERPFLPSITVVLTRPCEGLATGVTLF